MKSANDGYASSGHRWPPMPKQPNVKRQAKGLLRMCRLPQGRRRGPAREPPAASWSVAGRRPAAGLRPATAPTGRVRPRRRASPREQARAGGLLLACACRPAWRIPAEAASGGCGPGWLRSGPLGDCRGPTATPGPRRRRVTAPAGRARGFRPSVATPVHQVPDVGRGAATEGREVVPARSGQRCAAVAGNRFLRYSSNVPLPTARSGARWPPSRKASYAAPRKGTFTTARRRPDAFR